MSAAPGWLARHRGPFLFCVSRPDSRGKRMGKNFHTSEWLPGLVEKADAVAEAVALLTDSRDTVRSVALWSVKEEQFVGGFRR